MTVFKKKLLRVMIYLLLVCSVLTVSALVHKIRAANRDSQLALAQQQESTKVTSAFNDLKKKEANYQSQGLDTGSFEPKFDLINVTIYSRQDYQLADRLITRIDGQLDKMLSEDKARKEEAAAQAEAIKGNLNGKISCAGEKCNGLTLKLLSGKDTVATAQADEAGKYSFHVNAGKYNLSARASGFESVYRAGISVNSQTDTRVDLDLAKIVVQPAPAVSAAALSSSQAISDNTQIVLGNSQTIAAASNPVVESPNTGPAGQIAAILNLINDYRQSNGQNLLALDTDLGNAARDHSAWMSKNGKVSHNGENNSLPWDRCAAKRVKCSGEIIFFGLGGPQAAVDGWKNSPPHNAIMLGNNFKTIGIGIVDDYYTADLN